MHFHQKTAQFASLNGFKVLLILLVVYASCVQSTLTPDEIADAVNEASPARYCGKKLTEAIKTFCTPFMKTLIMKQGNNPVKKSMDSSPDLDFETFDLDRIASENYEDEIVRSRYKIDDPYFSNDIPFLFAQAANRRRRRGIIDDCCKRACYKTELIRYCPLKG